MSAVADFLEANTEIPSPDLIDRIAHALPEDVRTEYYRELNHCRSLPESDEMLRILRAMQFLTVLIDRAPSRVTEERERMEDLLALATANISKVSTSSEAYHLDLQKKLTLLPEAVAKGISPEAVAEKINEQLHEEFQRSSIPQTAKDLGAISQQMKNVCLQFSDTSDKLGHEYRGVAEKARQAISSLNDEIAQATESAERFTAELTEKFSMAYRWSMGALATGALVLGLAIGILLGYWLFSRPEPAAPSTQSSTSQSSTFINK